MEKWMADLAAKLQAEGKSLRDFLFDESIDLIQGKPKVDLKAKSAYEQAVELVSRWMLQGKCVFSFDDPNKPYYLHTIKVKWKVAEDNVEIGCSQLRELFDKVNSSLIIDESGEWQIGTVIYSAS